MMSEEEKEAIKDSKDILKELNKHKDKDFIGRLYYKNKPIEDILQILLDLIEKQQKEIEFYEIQELEYIQGYEDGKSHKQTAVAIKNENAQYELIKRVIEEKDKEIEKLKSRKYIFNAETNEIKEIPISDDYISKDKIKEKIEELKNRKIGASTGIFAVQVDILEELLGE